MFSCLSVSCILSIILYPFFIFLSYFYPFILSKIQYPIYISVSYFYPFILSKILYLISVSYFYPCMLPIYYLFSSNTGFLLSINIPNPIHIALSYLYSCILSISLYHIYITVVCILSISLYPINIPVSYQYH